MVDGEDAVDESRRLEPRAGAAELIGVVDGRVERGEDARGPLRAVDGEPRIGQSFSASTSPRRVASTGVPARSASTATRPNPSERDGTTTRANSPR